jgi:hypothetical protein
MTFASVPDLYAAALGLPRGGAGRCCYCGAPASDPHQLPGSFTAIDTLRAPGSGLRCAGCAAAMTAMQGQSPDGKPWMWSWAITMHQATRYALCAMLGGDRVKAGRDALRSLCLSPPRPPYALVLCQAGRAHTLYRAAIQWGWLGASLTYDGRVLHYEPATLAARIALCESVAQTFGIKTARDCLEIAPSRWSVDNCDLVEHWHAVRGDLLTAVAACLFPNPQEDQNCE